MPMRPVDNPSHALTGLRAQDVMTEDPIWIEATTTLGEIVRLFAEKHIRHLPVLEEGVVKGILSDRDVRIALPPLGGWSAEIAAVDEQLATPASALMTTDVQVIEPDRELRDVVDLMLEVGIGAVVVVDPLSNKLAGIISYVDILRLFRDAVWR